MNQADIDKECLAIGRAIMYAAGNLPDEIEMSITVDLGGSSVELWNYEGVRLIPNADFDNGEGLSYAINNATEHAKKLRGV